MAKSAKIFFVALMAFAVSCSKTKTGYVNRTFHNLSAHYNGYYNAGLKLDEGAQKLADGQQDQYDRILPIFKYGDAQKAKSVYPLMDDARKRTGVVIQRHTLVDKNGNELPGKEKWIDDNWLLYGKALFYKHDYFDAIETFKYVEATYKKEPTRFSASIWLAKTYLQLTQLHDAEEKLDYIHNQKGLPKDVRTEYEIVASDFYLQTKNYDKAIEHLTKASVMAKKRADRIRYTFILAQVYQQQGDFKKAFQLYTTVIKKNPVYEMAFNARINRARCYDSQSGNGESVKNELRKMAKDPKNKEYLDQVYYAMAGISQKEGNEPEEIDYLHKSIAASAGNDNQKAISYLELGKIYYSKPEYYKSQSYYDSCIVNLSNDYPDYTDILTRRNSLTKLIKSLTIIKNEDSLQSLSKMTAAERDKVAEDFIKKEEEEKKKKEEEEREAQVNQIFTNGTSQQANQLSQGGGSSWYFYNIQAIGFGLTEFTKKWGNRKLEDNWRRNNKEVLAQIEEEEVDTTPAKKEIKDPKEIREARKKELLAKIPVTDSAITKSTNKIIDAYYNASMIYNEQLKNPVASAETFEALLAKYPDNKYKLQAYYQLYRIYLAQGNSRSDYYKNILLDKYGDSDYAMIIKNPNYMAEKASKKSSLELFYEDTYRKYLNGEYADVIQRKSQADQMYPGNPLVPKFDLLKTLAVGHTQNVAMFTASLQDIVRNYSLDPVREQAQDILDYINGHNGKVEENVRPKPDTAARLYMYNPDTAHYVIVSYRALGLVKSDVLKVKLAEYNTKYYSTKGYTLSTQLYDPINEIIIIRAFANRDDAVAYEKDLKDNDEVFGNTNPDLITEFIISANNFPAFVRERKMEPYLDFYRSFYR